MMARCWAQELAPFGITVNSIGPGLIDTPLANPIIGEGEQRSGLERLIPMGRIGRPDDVAGLACWLASAEAEYVTGTYNLVDGGLADRGTFGLESPQAKIQQTIREARTTMSGEALLGHIDRLAAEQEANRQRPR